MTNLGNRWGYFFRHAGLSPIEGNTLRIGGVVTEESLWSKRGDEDSEGTQIDLIIDERPCGEYVRNKIL